MRNNKLIVILILIVLGVGNILIVINPHQDIVEADSISVAPDEKLIKPDYYGNRTIGSNIHIYQYHYNYTMDYDAPPTGIQINLEGDLKEPSERGQSAIISFKRPDNRELDRLIDEKVSNSTASSFSNKYYLGKNMDVRDRIYDWARPYAEGKEGVIVEGLRVSPSIITPGSGVNIVGKLTNLANEKGTVDLTIDGEKVAEYSVEAGDSKIISPGGQYPSLYQTFEKEGIHKIKLGDSEWTVSVVPQDQIVTGLKVTDLNKSYYADVGEKVTIRFDANNTSNNEITDSVYVRGKPIKNFTVPANEKIENITATIDADKTGTLPVRVGDQNTNIFIYMSGLPDYEEIHPVRVLFSKANDNIFNTDSDILKGEYQIRITVIGDRTEFNYSEKANCIKIKGGDKTPPTADAGEKITVSVGEEFTLNASESSDNVAITSYRWNLDNGESKTGEKITYAYDSVGTYQVKLTVFDEARNTDTDTVEITVELIDDSNDGNDDDEGVEGDTSGDDSGDEDTPGFTLMILLFSLSLVAIYRYRKKKR